jgi:type VI secretion system secreted protein VgrG
MPPVQLPAENTLAGIKSCIFTGNPGSHFNAVIFHDTPGLEYVQVHSEKYEMSNSERNRFQYVQQAQFSFHGNF